VAANVLKIYLSYLKERSNMKLFNKILYKIVRRFKRYINQIQYNHIKEKYHIPKSFKFNGENILFYGEGKILIGENSYIGRYSSIQSGENCTVKIGDNCKISHFVLIYTTSTDPNQDFNSKVLVNYSKDVIIGNGVWIGAHVFINPGVIIGDNSVIGANSVVTKNIPENSIYAGTPAKLIRFKKN
jgi:maltose O-acetyltransferase